MDKLIPISIINFKTQCLPILLNLLYSHSKIIMLTLFSQINLIFRIIKCQNLPSKQLLAINSIRKLVQIIMLSLKIISIITSNPIISIPSPKIIISISQTILIIKTPYQTTILILIPSNRISQLNLRLKLQTILIQDLTVI